MTIPAVTLLDAAAATVTSLGIQAAMTGGAWDKLVETAPMAAVLLAGLWIVFSAYRSLVNLVVQALSENQKTMQRLADNVESLEKRLHE